MRDDFQITHPVIDEMVSVSRDFGAVGSRMTGGGFGGCFVSLVADENHDEWRRKMEITFQDITPI